VERKKPVRLILSLFLCVCIVLLSCADSKKEDLVGEYEAEHEGVKVTLSLNKDMTYKQIVLLQDGSRKEFAGRWDFIQSESRLGLAKVYNISDGTIDYGESLVVEKILGHVRIPVGPVLVYYDKVKSH
jgi:hypothetical protein